VRIGVIMGGPSSEHAISLKSGHGIVDALTRRGRDVQALEIPQELTAEQAYGHTRSWLVRHRIDVVFIALHGPFGEDGTVQQLCESMGLAYTGSGVEASRLGLDKVASRRRFEAAGLRVPGWRLLESADAASTREAAESLGWPVVVKPTNQGSSIGISVAAGPEQLDEAVERARRYDARLLLEAFVRGREVTAGILDDEVLPVVEIRPREGFFDYVAKYTPGQTTYIAPAELDAEVARRVQQAGLVAHRALGCRHFSRVDLLLPDDGQPVVLEVNTIPGFTATSLLPKAAACVGISYEDLCERMVSLATGPAQPAPAAHRAA
jgi:D-alanine-D-alanine ligase